MASLAVLRDLTREMHISHSQVRTWLSCSLQYYFRYVAGLPRERVGIGLPFGSAVHSTLERHYRTVKETGEGEPLPVLEDFFAGNLRERLAALDCPVVWKKETPDRDGALAMGRALLRTFHENSRGCLDGLEVFGVELPLSAPLRNGDGEDTGLVLVGVVDLLLRDSEGRGVAVDHKTASRQLSQEDVDEDTQMSAYAYLLAENGYAFPSAGISCRYDVLRKRKTPKLEQVRTVRTPEDRRHFGKVASAVAHGIEERVFVPCRSWLCSDCSYGEACRRW